jgi:hypothetical protein
MGEQMPEIGHHDLVLFADQKVNLKKDEVDDQRAQVNGCASASRRRSL